MAIFNRLVVAQLMGGLGNQMFQYAAGKALALRLDAEYEIDLSWFRCMGDCTPRNFGLNAFNISTQEFAKQEFCSKPSILRRATTFLSRQILDSSIVVVHEPHFHYWAGFEKLSGRIFLLGYWQSERYFKNIANVIRDDFMFPSFQSNQSHELYKKIKSSKNSVAVHVRRGDYINKPAAITLHGGCCPPSYYKDSINYIKEKSNKLNLYIFSDDPSWVKDNFDPHGHATTIVDVPEHIKAPYHDMHLMSLCRHHIVANSSFSWWGAWLSRQEGIVCAPRLWFSDLNIDTRDIYPETWIRL